MEGRSDGGQGRYHGGQGRLGGRQGGGRWLTGQGRSRSGLGRSLWWTGKVQIHLSTLSTVLHSTEYHNAIHNTMILFWKYLVDIRNEARLNLF